MKATTRAKTSRKASQASTAKAKALPRQRGSQGRTAQRTAQPPGPTLDHAREGLIADTSAALVALTELLEVTDLVRADLERQVARRDGGTDALRWLGQARRLLWALGNDLRGISGYLTGLHCEEALGTHIGALSYLAGCCADDDERGRALGPALEAIAG